MRRAADSRPYKRMVTHGRIRTHPPLCGCRDGPVLLAGAGPRPARRRPQGSPLRRKPAPETLVRQTQAQNWDRANPNFLPAQAPSGAGRNGTQALLVLRAGRVVPTLRGNSRKQGSGADSPCQGEMARRARGGRVGDYEHEVLIRSRPRGRFGSFAAMGKGTRRPQAAKSPVFNVPYFHYFHYRPLIRPFGPPVPIPSVASRHLPLTRGVGPQGEGL